MAVKTRQQPSRAVAALLWSIMALSGVWSQHGHAADRQEGGSQQAGLKGTGNELVDRCNACHGEGGQSDTPDIPSIGGFTDFAIMELFNTYRLGLRKARTVALLDGTETNMEEVVASLSEEDEWTVSAYFSKQRWRPPDQPFDADLAALGAEIHDERCDNCHHDGGRDPDFDLPITAGQWREYLVAEFDNFDSGRRKMSEKMKKKYDTLTAADKRAIIELYVSAGKYRD